MLIYEVAYHLRLPLYEMVERMTYAEFLGWLAYFDRRPPEWREDDRAAKLMQAWGAKAKPWDIFPALEPIYNAKPTEPLKEGQIDGEAFKGSLLFHKMLSAKGGDKLDL